MANNGARATMVTTGEVRLSFAHLFEPRADDNGVEKYSALLLVPKSDKATMKALRAAEEAAKQAGVATRWNGKMPKVIGSIIHDGDEEKDTDEYPEFAGHYYLTVSSKDQPGIVDRNVQAILDSTEVYSGCYVRANINAYPYTYGSKAGVSFGLNHVQKLRDGEMFGGRSRASDVFSAVESDEDDDLI